MTFIGPSQRAQTMTSTANTRLSRAAQSRRYVERSGDGFDGVVDGANLGAVSAIGSAHTATGGGGTLLERRRLVGAQTPWNLVRLA